MKDGRGYELKAGDHVAVLLHDNGSCYPTSWLAIGVVVDTSSALDVVQVDISSTNVPHFTCQVPGDVYKLYED